MRGNSGQRKAGDAKGNRQGIGAKHGLTMSQLKLAVAAEFKAEGYGIITFDKTIEGCGRRVKVHVYCEDEFGMGEAVYCINDPRHMDLQKVLEILELIEGELLRNDVDCTVSLAFPLNLLHKAKDLIGLTPKVYMVDGEGRVWVHYQWKGFRRAEFSTNNSSEEEEGDDLPGAVSTQMRRAPYYIV